MSKLPLKFSSSSQLKSITTILSSKEKLALYLAIFVFLFSFVYWGVSHYLSSTQKAPDYGGEFTEGIIGEPLYVNPILAQTNEIDSSLSQLIFSSLLKYDNQGNLINDLADSYEITDGGKTYTVKIKQEVLWHDKTPLTAHDVLFTVKLIQDSAYKSSLRGDWQDIQASVIDDQTIVFQLAKPYAPFPNKLTFGILPRHIFEQIPSDNFLLSEFNLKPIGSGPFVFSDFKKDDQNNLISYQLLANQEYYYGRPFLDRINFNFYPNEDALLEAYKRKEVSGFGILSYQKINEFSQRKDSQIISMRTPRYFAVFFNQTKSKPLAEKNVRLALLYATDKKSLINEVFGGNAEPIYSPIISSFGQFSANPDFDKHEYKPEKTQKLLEESGWKKKDDGFYYKDEQPLEITLITTQWPDLARTSEILKSQWESVGIKTTVTNLTISEIQQNFIRPREYQSILFGQEYFGNDPDPYYFWHSSGKKDPGRNIAVYGNDNVDKLLEETREILDIEKRKTNYAEFEKTLSEDVPALFLYSPHYIYITNNKIKGVDTQSIINPSFRFSDTAHWFIKTKRIKK